MANKKVNLTPRCEIMLIGNLGSDPDLITTSRGTRIVRFSVANNTHKKGHPRNTLVWRQCTAFNDLAEYISDNYKKGDLIWIKKATPDIEKWVDRSGENRTTEKWCVWEIGEDIEAVEKSGYVEPTDPAFDPDAEIPF